MAHGSGAHAGHLSVSDSIQVVVGGGTPPAVVAPPVVAPPVDSTGPRISRIGPRRTVVDRTPTIRAGCVTATPGCVPRSIGLRLDGRRVTGMTYVAARDLVRWTPRKQLAPGRHVVTPRGAGRCRQPHRAGWRFTVLAAVATLP